MVTGAYTGWSAEGYIINHKRLFRLYWEERLRVRRRSGRKRAVGTGRR
jgi:putative transposase